MDDLFEEYNNLNRSDQLLVETMACLLNCTDEQLANILGYARAVTKNGFALKRKDKENG